MSFKQQMIDTYNQRAQAFADKFDEIGARVEDIEDVFSVLKQENPIVLEIGCGNGRDAAEIVKRTSHYLGIDISEKLIELARIKVPTAKFTVADIESYTPPATLDAVFAFASLLHVNRVNLRAVLETLRTYLSSQGLIRISLKYAPSYQEKLQTDGFGQRIFYLYSSQDIEELGQGFTILKNDIVTMQGQTWLEVLLQKKN
jgi:SAM-dependent methyltransferase